jgi:hypothetical protein
MVDVCGAKIIGFPWSEIITAAKPLKLAGLWGVIEGGIVPKSPNQF